MRTVLSRNPTRCVAPLGDQATLYTVPLCPLSVRITSPVFRIPQPDGIVPGAGTEPSAVGRPSNRSTVNDSVCPSSSRSARPLTASQSRIVRLPNRMPAFFPSGDQATPTTESPCALQNPNLLPGRGVPKTALSCHRLTTRKRRSIRRPGNADNHCSMLKRPQEPPALHVPEPDGLVCDGDARMRPSGDRAILKTLPVCPRSVWRSFRAGWGLSAGRRAGCSCDAFSFGAILFSPAVSMLSAICDTGRHRQVVARRALNNAREDNAHSATSADTSRITASRFSHPA